MQSQRSYNNAIFIDKNTDTKTDKNITSNYKKRREELNEIVGRHIERQKQRATQKKNSVSV